MTTPAFSALQAPTSIDYTSKDWSALVSSMLEYAAIIMPEWDTSSEGDFGVMLVELFAYMGDILSFYGDRLTQEAYLPTATQRLSILNIAQLLGYLPINGSPAVGTVTFQNSTANSITVPAGTQVASSFSTTADQPIIFQVNSPTVVAANSTAVANVTQGITYTLQALGTSDGTAGQSFQIPQAIVESGTVSVFVGSSSTTAVQWTQVTFLVDYDGDEQVFSVSFDQNNMTSIAFGDNVNGQIPSVGLTIFATYTIGVGSLGNVGAGNVGTMVNPITGIVVPFQSPGSVLYQSSAMTSGSDPETNDQIRANAPLSYATQQRAVSLIDYANLSLQVPGVLVANAIANHATSVTLYILGPNYQSASTALQNSVLAFLANNRTLAGTTVSIGTPALIPVDIGTSGNHMTLQVMPNFNQGVVVNNVTTALQSVLTPPNSTFGMLLNVSSIYGAIMAVPGVAYAVVPIMTREDVTQSNTNPIQFRASEIPTAGSIFITASGGIVT